MRRLVSGAAMVAVVFMLATPGEAARRPAGAHAHASHGAVGARRGDRVAHLRSYKPWYYGRAYRPYAYGWAPPYAYNPYGPYHAAPFPFFPFFGYGWAW